MEMAFERNPAVPTPLEIPRDLPVLPRSERSEALSRAFAGRARAFSCSLVLLFLPSIAQQFATFNTWAEPRLIVLLLGLGFCARVGMLKSANPQLRRWGELACLYLAGLLAFVVFPSGHNGSEWVLNELLTGIVLSGGFFLLTRWFLAGAALFASLYAIIVTSFYPGASATALWVRLGIVFLLALIVQRSQARICADFNLVTLTDEARLALYLKASEDARNAERRFERLANAGKEALILHSSGRIIEANSLAAELVGTERERLLGEPVAKLLAKSSQRLLTQASDTANSTFTKVRLVRSDGTFADAAGFHHHQVFPEGAVGVLVLRSTERRTDDERGCGCAGDTSMN